VIEDKSDNENDDYDNDDKSTMLLKASRNCDAGLDSDGSISSSKCHRVDIIAQRDRVHCYHYQWARKINANETSWTSVKSFIKK